MKTSDVTRMKALSQEARQLALRLGTASHPFDDAYDATGDPSQLARANRYLDAMMRAWRRQQRRFDKYWALKQEAKRL
jgi:hypothetical protein